MLGVGVVGEGTMGDCVQKARSGLDSGLPPPSSSLSVAQREDAVLLSHPRVFLLCPSPE